MEVRISGIVEDSIVDGPGLRVAIFTQGCPHNCVGCHNEHTHDMSGGRITTIGQIEDIIDKSILSDGVTFTGGEPFLQAKALSHVARFTKDKGLSTIAYTGYSWEDIINTGNDFMELAKYCDYVIDGKYQEKLRSLDLIFKGSSNQRIVDVKQSLKAGKVVAVDKMSILK